MRNALYTSALNIGLLLAPYAYSQGIEGGSDFSVDEWPGSREQAARLADEAKDDDWAAPREQRLAYELEGLERLELMAATVECRTTICGVWFEFSIANLKDLPIPDDQAGSELPIPLRLSSYVSGTLKETFRRYDMSVNHHIETRETDGLTTGIVELTATDMCRVGISRDDWCDYEDSSSGETLDLDSQASDSSTSQIFWDVSDVQALDPRLPPDPLLMLSLPKVRINSESRDWDWAPDMDDTIIREINDFGNVEDVECRTAVCRVTFFIDAPSAPPGLTDGRFDDSIQNVLNASSGRLTEYSTESQQRVNDDQMRTIVLIAGPQLQRQ